MKLLVNPVILTLERSQFRQIPGATVLAPGPEVFTIRPAHERQTLKEERQKTIFSRDGNATRSGRNADVSCGDRPG